ncbi:MAG: hypothetical protein KKA84_02635 [Bacteroidetes bacterium]|nr:hypothetical protein [Bacteroidota bacterium]
MFSNYLSTIDGVSIYPIVGLILFFTFFVGAILWVLRIDKEYITVMENLPLDNNDKLVNKSGFDNE